MNYEMAILPADNPKYLDAASCVQCLEPLVVLDEIKNHYGSHDVGFTDYEAVLKICRGCTLAHLQLNDVFVDFTEPVVIGWN